MAVFSMNQPAAPLPPPPLTPTVNNNQLIWKYWNAKFKRSRSDLLDDNVDPVEERHMDLTPDDEASFVAKLCSSKYLLSPAPLPIPIAKRARLSYTSCKNIERSPVSITVLAQPGSRYCFL